MGSPIPVSIGVTRSYPFIRPTSYGFNDPKDRSARYRYRFTAPGLTRRLQQEREDQHLSTSQLLHARARRPHLRAEVDLLHE